MLVLRYGIFVCFVFFEFQYAKLHFK